MAFIKTPVESLLHGLVSTPDLVSLYQTNAHFCQTMNLLADIGVSLVETIATKARLQQEAAEEFMKYLREHPSPLLLPNPNRDDVHRSNLPC